MPAADPTDAGGRLTPVAIRPLPSIPANERSIAPDAVGATFEDLLAGVVGTAYQLALSLTGQPSAAGALVEEAALKAFHAPKGFGLDVDFRGWFLGVLTDVFLTRCPEPDPAAAAPALDGTTEEIVRAIRALPIDLRIVTAIYFTEDLRYEEIGAVLDLPVATVRSRLHRGRRCVMRALRPIPGERLRV
jgi:RNA polymerase sigma-70 factor (ECF subfamily)